MAAARAFARLSLKRSFTLSQEELAELRRASLLDCGSRGCPARPLYGWPALRAGVMQLPRQEGRARPETFWVNTPARAFCLSSAAAQLVRLLVGRVGPHQKVAVWCEIDH